MPTIKEHLQSINLRLNTLGELAKQNFELGKARGYDQGFTFGYKKGRDDGMREGYEEGKLFVTKPPKGLTNINTLYSKKSRR